MRILDHDANVKNIGLYQMVRQPRTRMYTPGSSQTDIVDTQNLRDDMSRIYLDDDQDTRALLYDRDDSV